MSPHSQLSPPASANCQQQLVDKHFQSRAGQWKEVYEQTTTEGAIYRNRLATILRWVDQLGLPLGEQVLEIGCGGGASVTALAKCGYLVQAIDSVPEMLNLTQRSVADAGFSSSISTSLGDAHSLAFPDETFGFVLAIGVIPYLHSPTKALGEMVRVLKPGGYLIITQANRRRLHRVLDPWHWPPLQGARKIARTMLQPFRESAPEAFSAPLRLGSFRELERWLSSVGLIKVKVKTVGFQPLTFCSRPVFRERTSIKLNHWLQLLADHNVPGVRSSGMDYVILARKGATS
jgi:ubiquinone/menaquinone biosynthesis C-methylase UbiE